MDNTYAAKNVVLDNILGAELHVIPNDGNVTEAMEVVFKNLKQTGKNPYLIPVGGSNEIGAMGYVLAA